MPQQVKQADADYSQRVFTVEEAGEILKIAAHLQEGQLNYEQLAAIAQEVGISREALTQAIQNVEARKNTAISRAARRRALVRNLFKSAVLVALAGALTLALVFLNSFSRSSPSEDAALFASSSEVQVYIQKPYGEQGTAQHVILQSYVGKVKIGKSFGRIDVASVSPDGDYVALYDGFYNDLWIVRADGTDLKQVVQRGVVLETGQSVHIRVSDHSFSFRWEKFGGSLYLNIPIPSRPGEFYSIRVD